MRGLKHAFRVPVLAGFPAGRTIVIAVFTHFNDSSSHVLVYFTHEPERLTISDGKPP